MFSEKKGSQNLSKEIKKIVKEEYIDEKQSYEILSKFLSERSQQQDESMFSVSTYLDETASNLSDSYVEQLESLKNNLNKKRKK
jgi:Glu-tRNA(Gln) amidotransferase subunit E-like FAD-binding protein